MAAALAACRQGGQWSSTKFFNGFNDSLGEEAVCVASIPEAEIPTRPEMSAREVTAQVREILERGDEPAVVANLANTDQVGHTGHMDAAQRAAACVDACLGELHEICQAEGYTLIVTSDHGNADVMVDGEGRPLGSHSPSPVPLIVVPAQTGTLPLTVTEGSLANVGATFLTALGIEPPQWMEPSLVAPEGDRP